MERKGSVIFWTVTEMNVPLEKIVDLGFGEFVPRQDFKSSLIRALKLACKKTDDQFYKRFNDVPGSCSFSVVNTVFGKLSNGEPDISFEKEITIKVNKTSGVIETNLQCPLYDLIDKTYRAAIGTIDSDLFRRCVLGFLKEKCKSVALLGRGGAYFVDKRFDEQIGKLFEFTSKFPNVSLKSLPVYNDEETLDVIEAATVDKLQTEILETLTELKKIPATGITKVMLERRQSKVNALQVEILGHQENLRGQLESLTKSVTDISEALNKCSGEVIDPEHFLSLLNAL